MTTQDPTFVVDPEGVGFATPPEVIVDPEGEDFTTPPEVIVDPEGEDFTTPPEVIVDPEDPTGGGGGGGTVVPTTRTFNGIPGPSQLWRVGTGDDARWFIVKFIPPTAGINDDYIPLAWEVPSDQDLQALLGVDETGAPITPTADRVFSSRQRMRRAGAVTFGTTDELANFSKDPFLTWVEDYETQSEVRPWMRNMEVMRLVAAALLEGRSITSAELQTTRWWQNHNEAERAWLVQVEADPSTARQVLDDNRLAITERLRAAGINNMPSALANFMADRFTTGRWSQAYLAQQVRLVSDPFARGVIDEDLARRLDKLTGKGRTLDTTQEGEDQVRALAREWLGPMHGQLTEDLVAKWAGRLRNDPDGLTRLTANLQRQRAALFPEYEDDTLTYEAIASPWRSFFTQQWGQAPDETDALFSDVVRLNDATAAAKLLRQEGVKRGVAGVRDRAIGALFSQFGSSTRNPI